MQNGGQSKDTERNKSKKSEAKSSIKKIRLALAEKNKDLATQLLPVVQSTIAKLTKSGILKNNSAARRISRLSQQVSRL